MTRRARGNRLPRWLPLGLALPAIVLVAGFYAWPVVALATKAIGANAVLTVLHDGALRHILWFTTWQAILSTAITVGVGLVPAWALSRFRFRGHRWLTALITVPFVLPTVVVGAAFLALLPDSLGHGVFAIVLAHVFFNVAVVVRGVGGLWQQLPDDMVSAARTLGASPWRTMRSVTLPLLAPAIFASASVVFLFTFTSFGVARLLGGPAHETIEVEIWRRATRFGDIGAAAVLSVAQLVVLGIAVLWFGRVQSRHRLALGLRPSDQRRRAVFTGERIGLMATCAATVAFVCLPIAALVEQSFRTAPGRRSLAAWRAVFGDAPPGTPTRPGITSDIDALGAITTSLRFAVVAMLLSVVIGGCAALAITALGGSRPGGSGPGRSGLGRSGLGRSGLGRSGLGRSGLGRSGLGRSGLGRSGLGRSGLGRSGLGRSGRALDSGIMLPLGTSAVTIGFGLIVAFDSPPFDWRAAPLLIPLGHALVATPFVVRVLLPTLRSIDGRLRDAAATLGASPMRAWREVDVRLALPPLLTGAGFAMAISLGEFGATSFLTRQGRVTLPIAIDEMLGKPAALLHAQGYVLATVLAALTFAVIGGVELLRGGRRSTSESTRWGQRARGT